jgi:GAF domain-containing protein
VVADNGAGMNIALRKGHMNANMLPTQAAFDAFSGHLQAEGLRPALAYLLKLTDYRFIALFRFQGDRANAAVFYDREHPDVLRIDEVAANATYCCFARDARGVFATTNAMSDPRLLSHVAREAVQAYWGVPVMTPEGEILGTLCHYDVVPRETRQIDLELMLSVASTIERQGLVPPYPTPDG